MPAVFATKLPCVVDDGKTSSDESNIYVTQKSKDPEPFYEERWIERRTRRRNRNKHSSRRGSRSFSEEELRVSKSRGEPTETRRAKSENARYSDKEGRETSIGKGDAR